MEIRIPIDFSTMRLRYFLTILTVLSANASIVCADKLVTYDKDVQPVLREHCFACHNQDEAKSSLALDSFSGVVAGGASGEVVVAGEPESSRLWRLVAHQEEPDMPPGDKLPEAQLEILRTWIEGGLLEKEGSKPMQKSKPAIAALDAAPTRQPLGKPTMPEQLFHEPLLWTSQVGPVDAITTSPWSPLAAIAWQRQIAFYDTDSREFLGVLPYFDGMPQVVRFSRDGALLLVAGGRHAVEGSATLLDVKSGVRLTTLGEELDIVLAADISPDMSLVALGGPKKKVRVYRVADGSLVYQIDKHTEWITAVGFSPDGQLLATADRNGSVFFWNAETGSERADLRGHTEAIRSLDWRADSAMVATASEDGTLRLWNAEGKPIKSIPAHSGGVLSVRCAQDGRWVSTGRDLHLKIWTAAGSLNTDLGKLPELPLAACFTHDGTQVVASDYSGQVRLFQLDTKQQVGTLPPNPEPLAQRLAGAETRLQKMQQLVQSSTHALSKRQTALEEGEAAHESHGKAITAAATSLENEQQREASAAEIQAAETKLAQITDQAAGLPDLEQLRMQRDEADAALATATQKFEQAQAAKAAILAQQTSYAKARAQLALEVDQLQRQQQQLSTKLDEVQQALHKTQQGAELLKSKQREFEQAETLRKKYAPKE